MFGYWIIVGILGLCIIYLATRPSHVRTTPRPAAVPTDDSHRPNLGGCIVLLVAIAIVVIVLVLLFIVTR
jgi:hypothetical protein